MVEQITSKYISTSVLPYDSIQNTTKMMVKLFEEMPFLALLPRISDKETVLNLTLGNIPGIKIKNEKISLKTTTNSYKQGLEKLDKAYNSPTYDHLAPFEVETEFLQKYLNIIKKFNSPNAFFNLIGPFTISQIIQDAAEAQMLVDKSYRKLFVQAVSVRALWLISKIKEYSPQTKPVIILNEPMLGNLGMLKRKHEDITSELVTNLLSKIIDKLHEAGALVVVQCFEKCDWQVVINSGVDIISFDAYNNPNNLCIIPDQITEFIEKGGKINWAIIPVTTESVVKSLDITYLRKRLLLTMDGLILAGVPRDLVYNSAMVSIQGEISHLPVFFAEKAVILSKQLSERIPTVK